MLVADASTAGVASVAGSLTSVVASLMEPTELFIRSAERIGTGPIAPSTLQLRCGCLTILRRTLLASWPEEGCALLIGSPGEGTALRLDHVWPACNRWGRQPDLQPWEATESQGRHSNFLLDPREQLAAQRWSRFRGCELIGVAHSHPDSPPVPSAADRRRGIPNQLMLILSGSQDPRAWWLEEDRQVRPVPIDVD